MNIQLDSNQSGVTGDIVPSKLNAGGKKHYVSPKVNQVLSTLGSLPGMQSLYPFVVLKASSSANFAKNFEWEGATPVPGSPHKARVSRLKPGHFPVKIKRKSNGKVEDELNVWIVWAEIKASSATNGTGDKGTFFLVRMGYEFEHDIKPANITKPGGDIPDLSGANTSSVPPSGGLNYKGSALTGGANKQWDSSRQIRQKTLNPSGVTLPGDASFHDNFHNYPSVTDGDGRPGGAGAISFRDWLVAGNDDAGVGDEDNNPYSAPHIGKLWGIDRPSRGIKHSEGSNGDTVEWRLHFREFARLEINGKWYLISDYFPWRVHYKLKKASGKWRNDGSSKATDNTGF